MFIPPKTVLTGSYILRLKLILIHSWKHERPEVYSLSLWKSSLKAMSAELCIIEDIQKPFSCYKDTMFGAAGRFLQIKS